MVTGTLKRQPLDSSNSETLEEFYSGEIEEGLVNIIKDPVEIYVELMETLKKRSSIAIQHDYNAWKNAEFDQRAGKLLLVDQADYATHHIFFDDNVEDSDECIVDVRDVVTGERIPYRKFIDKYVIRVDPVRAVLEPDYFVKMIEIAEHNREEEIERIELGLESEDEQKDQKMSPEEEWKHLQNMPNEEYLMRTVLPVLYQGMKVVDLERPNAPLEYLSLYLLKHQDQIKLPPKPAERS